MLILVNEPRVCTARPGGLLRMLGQGLADGKALTAAACNPFYKDVLSYQKFGG